jgi:hypothetical protein
MTNSPTSNLPFAADDWRILHGTAPNALLVGSPTTVSAAVAWLLPRLREPISTWEPEGVSEPSLPSTGTLVIRNVDALDAMQQWHLLDYLSRATQRVRVISLASAAVYPLVQRGEFLAALYYRLNVHCVHVPEPPSVAAVLRTTPRPHLGAAGAVRDADSTLSRPAAHAACRRHATP